jgi:REP element-mobilizing transposase RayT
MLIRRRVKMRPGGRRSIRIQGFDYGSPGAYFLTICARDLLPIFGNIVDERVNLTDIGRIVQNAWEAIPDHFPHVDLDAYVVMPNHIHGILYIDRRLRRYDDSDRAFGDVPLGSIPIVVRTFKAAVTREVNRLGGFKGSVWQRNYYEHVIRNEQSLNKLQEYIMDNPLKWNLDEHNIRR